VSAVLGVLVSIDFLLEGFLDNNGGLGSLYWA